MGKSREYHIILFGASGFTGKLVLRYYLQHYGLPSPDLNWAIAGRNKAKLEAVLADMEAIQPGAKRIDVLAGDVKDLAFVSSVAKRANVIATTVGPYALHGSIIVEACAQTGTDYIDITAETIWIRDMINKHEAKAKETGARLIHACGFDSVPSEMGTELVYSEMKRRGLKPKSIKFVIGESKGFISVGSILSLAGLFPIHRLHQLTNYYLLLPGNKRQNIRIGESRLVSWDKDLQRWRGPFALAGINRTFVGRSSWLLKRDPFYYIEYQSVPPGFLNYCKAWLLWFYTAALFSFLVLPPVKLLLTLCLKPGDGPTEEQMREGHCTCYLVGKATDATGKIHVIKGRVQMNGDPGYSQTAKMLAEGSILLATEETVATEGGFMAPASGLGPKMIERLNRQDMPIYLEKESDHGRSAEP